MHNSFLEEITELVAELAQKLVPRDDREQQAQKLAMQAQKSVRQLSGLPPTPPEKATDDLISVLNSTCLLLDRLVKHPEFLSNNKEIAERPKESDRKEEFVAQPAPVVAFPSSSSSSPINTNIPLESETELSATAKELIRLRDWVLMVKGTDSGLSGNTLEALYKQIGQILTKAGVTTLDEKGIFDYERQLIVSTKKTGDPEKNDWVYETVRPGYLFNEALIRPQEVITYLYERDVSSSDNTLS
jgi:hypothetical protein